MKYMTIEPKRLGSDQIVKFENGEISVIFSRRDEEMLRHHRETFSEKELRKYNKYFKKSLMKSFFPSRLVRLKLWLMGIRF